MTTTEKDAPARSSRSSDSNILAALSYILGILLPVVGVLVPLIIFFVKKEDKFVRFHALQTIAYWVALFVIFVALTIISGVIALASAGIGGILAFCQLPLGLVFFLYTFYLAYMAFQGKMYYIPVIGNFVEKYI